MPMTIQSSSPASPSSCATLEAAAAAFRTHGALPQGADVTSALLALEKSAKQTRLQIPPADLLGTWRLCFSAGKRSRYQSGQPMGNGFYVPRWAIAHLQFSAEDAYSPQLHIHNTLQVGPLHIRFTGPARYHPRKNLLAFDFTHLTLRCFGLPLYQGGFRRPQRQGNTFEETAIGQLPFFAFFAATDAYIAARGRGGGLALWIVDPLSS